MTMVCHRKLRSLPVRTAAVLLSLALATSIAGCKKQPPPPPGPPSVEVVPVVQTNVPIYREAVGTLEGDTNAAISAQVSGYLLSRNYTEGSRVTNGQVLFQIDPAPIQAALEKAKSELTQAEATELKYALMVKRYTPLAATEAISKQELDDAVQNQKAAQAQVEAARAALQTARLNLGFTTVRSPLTGIAGLASAQAQVGNLVGPTTGPLTTVTSEDPMRVYLSVSQRTMTEMQEQALAAGGTAENSAMPLLQLTLATGRVYPEKGHVKFRDNQVDVKTGTVRVVGEFPNPQGLLVPGMFVSVRALVKTETNALVVPQRAVTEMQGRYLVAVVGADNKTSIRPVNTGERIGQDWVVSGPLKPGDRIVVEGVQKVREGTLVNRVPFEQKPPVSVSSNSETEQSP